MHLHEQEVSFMLALYGAAKEFVQEKDRMDLAADFINELGKLDIDMNMVAPEIAEVDNYMSEALADWIDEEEDYDTYDSDDEDDYY